MPAVQLTELEVVWPLSRWHYFSPALADEELVNGHRPGIAERPGRSNIVCSDVVTR